VSRFFVWSLNSIALTKLFLSFAGRYAIETCQAKSEFFCFITFNKTKMRSIEANYKSIQIKNPNLGDYVCLAKAVKGRQFSRKNLVKAFKELVPKDDYEVSETKELIDHIECLTNIVEEGEI